MAVAVDAIVAIDVESVPVESISSAMIVIRLYHLHTSFISGRQGQGL